MTVCDSNPLTNSIDVVCDLLLECLYMLSNDNAMAEMVDNVKEHKDDVCVTETTDIKNENKTKSKIKSVVECPQSAACLLRSLREWNQIRVKDETLQKVLECLSEMYEVPQMSEVSNVTSTENVILELMRENDNLTMGDLSMLMTYHNQGLIAFSAKQSDACLIKVKKEFHVLNTAVEKANRQYEDEMNSFEKELEAMTVLSDINLDADKKCADKKCHSETN